MTDLNFPSCFCCCSIGRNKDKTDRTCETREKGKQECNKDLTVSHSSFLIRYNDEIYDILKPFFSIAECKDVFSSLY